MKRVPILAALVAALLPGLSAQVMASSMSSPPEQWALRTENSGQATKANLDGGALITVSSSSTYRDARVRVPTPGLAAGSYYVLHFQATASTTTPIEVLGRVGRDFTSLFFDRTIFLTPAWKDYEIEFRAIAGDSTHMSVNFCLGRQSGQYAIRNVSVDYESEPQGASQSAAAVQPVSAAADGSTWNIEMSGTAQAGPIYSATGLIIDIDRVDGKASDVQFACENVAVKNGTDYTVHFRARASAPRAAHVEVQDLASGNHPIGLSRDIALSPGWQEYSLPFTAAGGLSGRGRVTLMLGDQTGTVQVADISFGAARSGAAASMRTASTGGGASAAPTWTVQTGGSAIAVANPSPTGVDVEIDRPGAKPEDVALTQAGLDLVEGTAYVLSFAAKSSVARQATIVGQNDVAPFAQIGLNGTLHLRPEWQNYTLRFTAHGSLPGHAQVAFQLGGAMGTVDIADLKIAPDTAAGSSAGAAD